MRFRNVRSRIKVCVLRKIKPSIKIPKVDIFTKIITLKTRPVAYFSKIVFPKFNMASGVQ